MKTYALYVEIEEIDEENDSYRDVTDELWQAERAATVDTPSEAVALAARLTAVAQLGGGSEALARILDAADVDDPAQEAQHGH